MANTTQPRPMLAAKFEERRTIEHIKQDGFIIVQPKIDGMRVCFENGVARSRSWKPHSNRHLQKFAKDWSLAVDDFDGEVISGHVYDPNIFRESMSGIRAEDGSPTFTVYFFDNWRMTNYKYVERRIAVTKMVADMGSDVTVGAYHAKIICCPEWIAESLEEVYEHEARLLADGWEGAILRRPGLLYKWNRATPLDGALTKLKRFEDAEAVVVGYEPRYTNNNVATTNELGLTSRSSHMDNLQAEECLGALHVEYRPGIDGPNNGIAIEFKIGVFRGLDYDDKCRLWADRDTLIGRIVRFKHQGYGGGYDAPRTPVWISWRDPKDL